MRKIPEEDLPLYFKIKLIDAVKAMALDFETQRKLIPEEINQALVLELLDERDIYYERKSVFKNNLINSSFAKQFQEINEILQEIIKKNLYSTDDVRNHGEWEKVRSNCRSLLIQLGEENNFPDSFKPGWRFINKNKYGFFDSEKQ